MKNNLLKLAGGVALLGAVATASAQTSLLVGWNMYNSSSQAFPYAASTTDPSVFSAAMDYSSLFTLDDNRGFWGSDNHATTLDSAAAPYLSWTINLADGEAVINPTFFLDVGLGDSTTQVEMRSSLDGYSASLGDMSSVDGSWHNYMFSLGQTLSGSVNFRMYVYDVSADQPSTSVDLGNVNCGSGSSTYGGSYNPDMQNYTAGLLGTVSPTPEPSTMVLAGLGGFGLLLLCRRK